ncbi:MAG: glycosyltransferase [Rhodobacteraceae bacterium]|jgi:GT2 family glycosyltransferase|nr:glycosyltransferase [Paracoccaceae bacterium]
MTAGLTVGAVVIGRNEGQRLVRCLGSLADRVSATVYVDSGSSDGSVAAALAAGCHVVELDARHPFTAARARNAGLEALAKVLPDAAVVQFVDGDCEVVAGWIETAAAFLAAQESVAVVCGRTRERFPEATVWNGLIDREWKTPIGEAEACGGNAMMRIAAFRAVGMFDPRLIAGEEPELCLRLRRSGWKIWRIHAEMTLHDAAMTRFGQWWRRSRRAGHAAAEGAAMHGRGPERYNVARVRRALFWGAVLPVVVVLALAATPLAAILLLAWPLQVLRLRLRGHDLTEAFFLTLGKFPEALGVLSYALDRIRGRRRGLIEYK